MAKHEYDLSQLSTPLSISEIDFRVQSINGGKYATILAYKDARADMIRMDAAFGVLGWKREHSRDNKNCTVSVWDRDAEHWVSKEDTGTESMAEAAKGLASDSYKRACFNFGIGRELYDYPKISIRLNDDECNEFPVGSKKYKASFGLNIKAWRWSVQFDKKNQVTFLFCKDDKGKQRFLFGKYDAAKEQQETAPSPSSPEEPKANPTASIVGKLKEKVKG